MPRAPFGPPPTPMAVPLLHRAMDVAGGPVAEVVAHSVLRHHADLVIIGRGKLHETFGRLRTHAYSIIRDVPCPVLSL